MAVSTALNNRKDGCGKIQSIMATLCTKCIKICIYTFQLNTPSQQAITTSTTGWHCVSFFHQLRLKRPVDWSFSFFFITKEEEELRFQLVCAIWNLYRICCMGVCESVSEEDKDKARKKEMGEYIGCFVLSLCGLYCVCVIKRTSVCFHQRLVKCIWSSHTPPTPVPDSLLFIPCPCPWCCITYAEGFRCVCTCVRACVCVCVCAGVRGAWACVCLREQKREREESNGKVQRWIM